MDDNDDKYRMVTLLTEEEKEAMELKTCGNDLITLAVGSCSELSLFKSLSGDRYFSNFKNNKKGRATRPCLLLLKIRA